MTAINFLVSYKNTSTDLINKLIDCEIKKAEKLNSILVDDLAILKDFMSRGKRIRGALMNLGIHLAKNNWLPKDVFTPSLSFEFLHSALLMQDDIIDKDETRRGAPTVHHRYMSLHKEKYSGCDKDPYHFGISRTICLSDWAFFFSQNLIGESEFSTNSRILAANVLSRCVMKTVNGESLDVTFESLPAITEREVLLMMSYKTAHYTFSDPIRCGYFLGGGKDEAVDKAISNYGDNIGMAFQVRDDILGLFGDPDILGKPVGSDLKRRKNTLLIAKALEMGDKKQCSFINSVWGKENLNSDEFEKAKNIVKVTGSLNYSEKLAEKLLKKGKSYIPKITKNKKYQNLLEGFADLAVRRDK